MSVPVGYYRDHPDEIPARLDVLYKKWARIVAYQATRDPVVLDEKQLSIMDEYGLLLGHDEFPAWVFRTLRRTIDRLLTIQRFQSRRAA